MKIYFRIFFFALLSFITACKAADKIAGLAIRQIKPDYAFNLDSVPLPPDYDNKKNWLYTTDIASREADVFYIHPTSYFLNSNWNQAINLHSINNLTYYLIFSNQASAFLEVANVYAPLYRQANFYAFLDLKKNGEKALEIAYQDVKAAFDYYLYHFNDGRPFIIASHSQGTYLAKELIKYIDTHEAIRAKFITAYLVGWPINTSYLAELKTIRMCSDSTDIGCINSWNTQRKIAFKSFGEKETQVTNPLTWQSQEVEKGKEANLGALFITNPRFSFSQKNLFKGSFEFPADFTKTNDTLFIPQFIGAKTRKGIVEVKRPSNQKDLIMFLKTGNYHLYDYNFFYFNVQQNAVTRIKQFIQNKK
jgi:hypothetical protein